MSGALQVAITNTLHGSAGLTGWRWLFIINAIMTVVVGALGFVLLPDTPNNVNPRAIWFKKGHAQLAMERLERHGRADLGSMAPGSAHARWMRGRIRRIALAATTMLAATLTAACSAPSVCTAVDYVASLTVVLAEPRSDVTLELCVTEGCTPRALDASS